MEQSFLTLINKHQGIIHKVCRMYTQDDFDREDLFQEIVLQLWRSFSAYDPQQRFSTWMYRVALNTAITQLRKSGRRPIFLSFNGEEKPVSPDIPETKSEQLYQAISQLNQIDRAIVLLYLDNHSYQEIAEVMQVSVSNVGVRLNRIKQKLKQHITHHYHES